MRQLILFLSAQQEMSVSETLVRMIIRKGLFKKMKIESQKVLPTIAKTAIPAINATNVLMAGGKLQTIQNASIVQIIQIYGFNYSLQSL